MLSKSRNKCWPWTPPPPHQKDCYLQNSRPKNLKPYSILKISSVSTAPKCKSSFLFSCSLTTVSYRCPATRSLSKHVAWHKVKFCSRNRRSTAVCGVPVLHLANRICYGAGPSVHFVRSPPVTERGPGHGRKILNSKWFSLLAVSLFPACQQRGDNAI